jgi:hypothetical protein
VPSNGKHVNIGILNTSKNSSWKYHSMYFSENLCYNMQNRKRQSISKNSIQSNSKDLWTSENVFKIKLAYETHWQSGSIEWPIRFPDLTPQDLSLWRFIKESVHILPIPQNLNKLKVRIQGTWESVLFKWCAVCGMWVTILLICVQQPMVLIFKTYMWQQEPVNIFHQVLKLYSGYLRSFRINFNILVSKELL